LCFAARQQEVIHFVISAMVAAKKNRQSKGSSRRRNGATTKETRGENKLFWLAIVAIGAIVVLLLYWQHLSSTDNAARDTTRAQRYNQKGIALIQQNQLETSLGYFDECMKANPSLQTCYNNKAGALRMLGRRSQAIDTLVTGEQALIQEYGPEYKDLAFLYQSHFLLLKDLNKVEEAVTYIQKSIELAPSAKNYFNWASLTHLDHATKIQLFSKALELEPSYFPAYCHRAHSYLYTGDWELLERSQQQIERYQQQLINSNQQKTDSSTCLLPYHTTYMNISAAMMRDTAIQYAKREGTISNEGVLPKLLARDVPPVLDENGNQLRKLRVGYVSSDLDVHPVGRNMLGVFMAHDKSKFEVYAFATQHSPDDQITQAMYPHVTYIDMSQIQDYAAVARKIREDFQIDVLVDLNGWTAGNRLKLFAARPAPVQITHALGFVGTIGANQAFDYLISDNVSLPERFDEYYTEKIIRLPQAYLPASHSVVHLTSEGASYNPAVANKTQLRIDNDLPVEEDKFVFCSFQRFHRISREAFETWLRILTKTPDSVLWMTGAEGQQRQLLLERASSFGIKLANERIRFSSSVNPGKNLIRAQACDLHLDNWPYTAHSTGMDVLWAGVPLLVYLSDYHDETSERQVPKMASRVSAGLVHTLGMPQLVASSIDEFEAEAVRLATNRAAYIKLRNELLAKRLASPLFDLTLYARVHETAYLQLFQTFYEGRPPESLDVPTYKSPATQNQTRATTGNDDNMHEEF